RAFAYFTFKKGKVLTEIASKRLSAIREFTKFGSGFRIAMRDLEIRGAGNVLGAKQHGHMEAVGYDMYLRLLSEAISAKKGEEYVETKECLIDIAIDAHIPDSYIGDMSSRIDIYRRIASIKSKEDSLDVIDELNDRFGEPPASALSLIEVALLRNSLAKYGFTEINQRGGGLMLLTEKINTTVCDKIVKAFSNQAYTKLASQQKKVLVNAGSKPYIMIKGEFNSVDILREIVDALEK
ncbi:MAG: TRCF domain-containing protein, partial [Oscillospiraceae bacterium]